MRVTSVMQMLGRFLFAMLLGLLSGMVFEVACRAANQNGLEAWRLLHLEMEPTASARKLTHLGDLVEPDFGTDEEFYRKWLR